MKCKRIIILLSLIAVIICCKRNPICPDEPEYHFFTGDELNLLWENVDSALILQNKLNSGEIGQYDANSTYGKIDTIPFINQLNDTLDFVYRYSLSPETNQWCANAIPMIATSTLISFDESFINEIEIKLKKAITDELRYSIEFIFYDGQDFSSNFSLSDSVEIDYNVFDGGACESTIIYLKTYKSYYQHEDTTIEDCLFFLFYDQNQTEKFKIIYSNKYGFLHIIKNNNHEITRKF